MASLVTKRDETVEKLILTDNNLTSLYGTAEYELAVQPTTPANRILSSLFSPARLCFLLKYGIAYVERTDDNGIKRLEKHVMRYPQLFATFATRKRLDEGKKLGTIWHTQGSGKTALAFFLSRYLRDYYQERGQITRFFFIVDRIDLAEQAAREFRARGCAVEMVASREEFARAIKAPSSSNAGALPSIVVVNIQKFDEARATGFDYNLNVQRVFFIDEAHRDYKRGGTFLAQLMTSDRDAVRIALTGTPLINQQGNNTREIFGDYIHTYFYNQSIADGYTLKLLREDIRTEFRVLMQERIRELQEVDKLVDLNAVFEHERFVRPLCDYIVDDYLHSLVALGDESIGAMVVAHTAKQARKIHATLCELDPDLSSELILHDEGSKTSRKEIRESFTKDDSPINILVVYNMLLTGFDAHRLKKLYMCRTVAAHNLLQALTRVNRPYHDLAFGYVVDFADITEEYDKTNRAYLAELTQEYGDENEKWKSLFETQEQIESDLAHIRDLLFGYPIDNVVAFTNEISATEDKQRLYELRAALKRYRELRNVAFMHGFEGLYERFDIEKAHELLGEVEHRISMINLKQAMTLKDMSTGAINEVLSQIEFSFRRVGEEELTIADEFQDKLRRTYGEFGASLDPKDPEYVNLLEELRTRLAAHNIEEMSSAEMGEVISWLDKIRARVSELNLRDARLAREYGGDAKFLRVHKQVMRTPPPLTKSAVELHGILMRVKRGADGILLANANELDNEAFFKQDLTKQVLDSYRKAGIVFTPSQVTSVADAIASEYLSERRRAS